MSNYLTVNPGKATALLSESHSHWQTSPHPSARDKRRTAYRPMSSRIDLIDCVMYECVCVRVREEEEGSEREALWVIFVDSHVGEAVTANVWLYIHQTSAQSSLPSILCSCLDDSLLICVQLCLLKQHTYTLMHTNTSQLISGRLGHAALGEVSSQGGLDLNVYLHQSCTDLSALWYTRLWLRLYLEFSCLNF